MSNRIKKCSSDQTRNYCTLRLLPDHIADNNFSSAKVQQALVIFKVMNRITKILLAAACCMSITNLSHLISWDLTNAAAQDQDRNVLAVIKNTDNEDHENGNADMRVMMGSSDIHNSSASSLSPYNAEAYVPNPATECMLKLEKNYIPLMYEWNLANKPILHSVKIINDVFYVMLNMFDLQKDIQKEWRDGSYSCNGVPGGKVNKVFKEGIGNLIVECPASINASKDILAKFLAVPTTSPGNNTHIASEAFMYETELFDECERKDIQHFSNSHHDIKIGLTATFKGNRTKALEWAAYHHLIGFDHIWIYVNEDWNNTTKIVHRDYITWIPYKFNIVDTPHYNKPRAFTPFEIFRIASQNDALWRAKRMGLEWIVPSDVDEYVEFIPPKSKTSNDLPRIPSFGGQAVSVSDMDTLPKFLKMFQNAVGEKFVGIQLKSIPFGRNQNVENENAVKELAMDYKWRQRGILDSNFNSRYKLILNVKEATSVNIHYLGGSSRGNKDLWTPPARELRINHYKKPDKGVFNHKHGVLDPAKNEIELDTSLTERYRTELLHDLHQSTTKRNLRS